jgi:hypothetical protein
MRKLIPTLAFVTLLGAASAVSAQVSFGIRIGQPPAPKAYHVPPQPGPDYEWVEGYWEPQGQHYRWHDGHWSHPPRQGAYWREPYYAEGRYYRGGWEGGEANRRAEQKRPDQITGTAGHERK